MITNFFSNPNISKITSHKYGDNTASQCPYSPIIKKTKNYPSLTNTNKIKIQTKTLTKKISITWEINEKTFNIAKLAEKGDKKGVIGASLQFKNCKFNLEMCVNGWKRSQDGFAAFYLTVPKEIKIEKNIKQNSINHMFDDEIPEFFEEKQEEQINRDIHNSININNQENINKDNQSSNDFVARYTVEFGMNTNEKISRMSSIRNDFELGVGFPNFTETATLLSAINNDKLIFTINIEIFQCESKVKQTILPPRNKPEIAANQLMEAMYHKRSHSDTTIICFTDIRNKNKKTHIKVHKFVLTAASPVFSTFFNHQCKENTSSTIIIPEWNSQIIEAMIKFLYLGIIDLNQINSNSTSLEDDTDEDSLTDMEDLDSLNLNEIDSDGEERKSVELPNSNNKNNDDYNDDTFNLLISCPKNIQNLFELFRIAECYELHHLVISCCHESMSYLSIETALIFLIYLDKYYHVKEINQIINVILEFMVQNIKLIKKSSGYMYLLKCKPLLVDKLIDKITSR